MEGNMEEAFDSLANTIVYLCDQAGLRPELEKIVREHGGFD